MAAAENGDHEALSKEGNMAKQVKGPGYLAKNVDPFLTSIPVLLCCFTSGIIDAGVFNAWSVFASMQTGNTVILALGASHQPEGHPRLWLETMTAIFFFFVGSFSAGRVGRLLGTLRRYTLILSFFIQTILIVISAALVQSEVVPGLRTRGTDAYLQLIPLGMLAFQAGQQSVAAQHLGLNELPTTVLTSVFRDLGNDPNLFKPLTSNWPRNRRFSAAVLLLVGAIIGGWLSKTDSGLAAALWLAAAIKFCLTVTWLFWSADVPKETKS